MKYLCLVYLSAEKWSACPDSVCAAYAGQLQNSGHLLDGTPLHPVHTATTVRVRNGQTAVTDGPFAETKEALAGFYLIEARDGLAGRGGEPEDRARRPSTDPRAGSRYGAVGCRVSRAMIRAY